VTLVKVVLAYSSAAPKASKMPLMLAPPPRISVPADSTVTPLATPPLFNCSVAPLETVALTTSKSLPFNNHVRDSAFLSAGARLLVG
jgi:hypothetical protein